ncbi:DNA helicase RecQ [Cohaesibacter gelatinilyticus]|uniref:DNA helicase RecQ n=1 Tax=Cohaesibacter gelatinilyticus TaxID=372072 RepID=A0A285PNF0_9HYPH|nr:DNA helicase RecQ [Cohaesibacter gelatinilyticus]SNZ21656.1 ATP-dependent DNA helicase RecQ [Cohaesibacter gelatinilyticus]
MALPAPSPASDPESQISCPLDDLEIDRDAPVSEQALQVLKTVYGYDAFRGKQAEVIDSLLEKKCTLAVMPTGMGKSICFQIPAMIFGGLTLVVSPLVALMEDQVMALKLAGIPADSINSTRTREENVAIWRKVAAGELRMLYIAPERLMTERMLAALAKLSVNLIAIDEAHCISRWGPSFRPDYEGLSRLHDFFPKAPIAALTATADETTREDIADKLFPRNDEGKRLGDVIVSGFDRPNIRLSVTQRNDWKKQLLDFVEARKEQSGIVYCLSRRKTEEVTAFLQENGLRAFAYHAGLDKTVRAAAQSRFMREAGVVMVATIAFGMGIDKPDVRYVFHTNLPSNMEAYAQEIGRAGRDGAPSEAMMLYGLDDIKMRRSFIDNEGGDDDHRAREHKRLDALLAYCEAPQCRRQALLSYFGEDIKACGNCDVCLDPPRLTDGTVQAHKLIEVVESTGQSFGAVQMIDILRGLTHEKIKRFGHEKLSCHGAGKETSKEDWRAIVRQMVATGFFKLDIANHGALKLTDKSISLKMGEIRFAYRPDVMGPAELSRPRRAKSNLPQLDNADQDLFEALRQCRTELAREHKVPAYVIFSDKTLHDMAIQKPTTRPDFLLVHGVGSSKQRKFADTFIDVIEAWMG